MGVTVGKAFKSWVKPFRPESWDCYSNVVESVELIAETNALLRQVLERDDEQKREAAKAKEEFEQKVSEVSSYASASDEDDLTKRMVAAQEQSRQRMEEIRQKDFEYKELMLNEAREQTQLLRAIREKLQA